MLLTFQRIKTKVNVTVKQDDEIVHVDSFSPFSARGHERLAKAAKVDVKTLLPHILNATEEGSTLDLSTTSDRVDPPVRVRGIYETRDNAVTFTSIDDALTYATHAAAEPVIEWDDIENLAALDVDVDNSIRLPATFDPTPVYRWRTHGGGGRYIYKSIDGFTAEELAHVAAVAVTRINPDVRVEVKTETRHPLYKRGTQTCGPIERPTPSSDVGALNAWLVGEVTSVEEWLEDNQLEVGKAYPHTRCPVDSSVESHGTPVYVGEHGILCHRCQALGVRHGSRKEGWFPYSSLVPGSVSPTLKTLVKNLTHWEHARHFIGVTGATAEKCYSALLKLYHPDDPRVRSVFTAGQDLIRVEGRWCTVDLSTTYTRDISRLLSTLPATQYVEEGKVRVDGSIVERFRQSVDLTAFGYPPLTPVRGAVIYGHHLEYEDTRRTNLVTPNARHRSPERERYRPRYVEGGDVKAAEEVVESVFPGVDWNYLRLLIAAKGCVEGRIGLQPYILVSGPSGSAKSGTVDLAATITGDTNTDVIYQPDINRFRQSVHEAIDRGSYATLNEVLKEGKASRKSARETLDVVLNLTPNSVSHVLYVGPVPLGRPPVFVFTDVHIPQSIRDDVQLSRRFIYVPLSKRLDWETPLATSGVLQIPDFRHTSEKYAHAANVILSDVIDRFFLEPTELRFVAKELGFNTLEHSTEFTDPKDQLRLLFDEVCKAPATDSQRYSADKGWRQIRRGGETPLEEVWSTVCDEENFTESRRLNETDWGQLLGVSDVVKCDVRSHRATVYVRFRVGPFDNPEVLNRDILRRG